MSAAAILREARGDAGMSQRRLAALAGVPQPSVARIESGTVEPRFDTLDRLLAACGQGLRLEARAGAGVDRSVIRSMLALSPTQRLMVAAAEANNLDPLAR